MEIIDGWADMSVNHWESTVLGLPFCATVSRMENGAVCATTPPLIRGRKKYCMEVTNLRCIVFHSHEFILSTPRLAAV